jgi:NAD(P)-dependent dehydrogenase (short-subunit alcohol dehydrogenase family)
VGELGGLDAVSVNAGVNGGFATSENTPDDAWEAIVGVNLTGAFYSARACIPHLRARGGGSIIFTGSVASLKCSAHIVAYNAAKHGVLVVMRTMAIEYAPEFIRVNAVLPTSIGTSMIRNQACVELIRPDLENPQFEDTLDAFQSINLLPLPLIEARDISNAIVWLSSDEARMITGVALPVDAGALTK